MRNVKKLVNGNIEVTINTRLKYDGHKTVIVQPDTELTALDPDTMTALQKAVVQGFQYRDALESGQVRSVSELARKESQERALSAKWWTYLVCSITFASDATGHSIPVHAYLDSQIIFLTVFSHQTTKSVYPPA